MNTYTLAECTQLLACTYRQLKRMLSDANISPTTAQDDGRARLLTDDQLDMVRGLLTSERRRKPAIPTPGATDPAILRRLEALEREVLALRRDVKRGQLPASFAEIPVSVMPLPPAAAFPLSKAKAGRLAATHGGKSKESAVRWFDDLTDLADTVSALRCAKMYLAGHPNAGLWRECDQADCPCHSL